MEKYRVTGWDFYRDDCTKLILSVSLYLLFPATLNFLSVPNHRMSHKKITLKTNWINLSIVGFKEVQVVFTGSWSVNYNPGYWLLSSKALLKSKVAQKNAALGFIPFYQTSLYHKSVSHN